MNDYLHCESLQGKLTRAGFELVSSGYQTAALPVELSSQIGTVFYPTEVHETFSKEFNTRYP